MKSRPWDAVSTVWNILLNSLYIIVDRKTKSWNQFSPCPPFRWNRKDGAPPTRFGNGRSKPVTKRWATRPPFSMNPKRWGTPASVWDKKIKIGLENMGHPADRKNG